MVVFGQSGCNWAKVVVFGQSNSTRANVVIFGQGGCIRAKWFYYRKSVFFGQNLFYSVKVLVFL